jgi:hypothetical protein
MSDPRAYRDGRAYLKHMVRNCTAEYRLACGSYAADRALLNRFFTLPNLLKNLDVMCEFTKNVIDKVFLSPAIFQGQSYSVYANFVGLAFSTGWQVASQGASKNWDIVDAMTEISTHYAFFMSVSSRTKVSNYGKAAMFLTHGRGLVGCDNPM